MVSHYIEDTDRDRQLSELFPGIIAELLQAKFENLVFDELEAPNSQTGLPEPLAMHDDYTECHLEVMSDCVRLYWWISIVYRFQTPDWMKAIEISTTESTSTGFEFCAQQCRDFIELYRMHSFRSDGSPKLRFRPGLFDSYVRARSLLEAKERSSLIELTAKLANYARDNAQAINATTMASLVETAMGLAYLIEDGECMMPSEFEREATMRDLSSNSFWNAYDHLDHVGRRLFGFDELR